MRRQHTHTIPATIRWIAFFLPLPLQLPSVYFLIHQYTFIILVRVRSASHVKMSKVAFSFRHRHSLFVILSVHAPVVKMSTQGAGQLSVSGTNRPYSRSQSGAASELDSPTQYLAVRAYERRTLALCKGIASHYFLTDWNSPTITDLSHSTHSAKPIT